jgi:AmmeMemoRadiSam system protein B/AmmeMemoRadiSam system protein A
VQGFLGRVEPDTLPGYPIALLAPHAGYQYSGPTAAYAYASLKGRSYARVFLLGPSHRDSFHGVALPEDTHFETPLGKVPLDTETMAALAHEELFVVRPSAHAREHSLEIQLPFLQTVLPRFRLVPLVLSDLTQAETEKVAAALRKVMGPGDLVVASSDFTHYGPRFGYLGPPSAPFGKEQAAEKLKELLEAAWAAIEKKDVEAFFKHQRETEDTICGFLPIAVLLKLLPSEAAAKLLKTDFSGRMTGDFDESVSYLSAAFCGLWPYEAVSGGGSLTDGEKADLLKLARASVDTYVKTRTKVTPGGVGVEVTPRLRQQNGAFVTLKKHGDLRGCIGTILPVKPLLDAVIDNGINAAVNDGRFEPVTEGELGEIEVEVSVLTTPTEIAGQEEFILGRHGIIIQKNGRSAVFLPQVAPEQGWTVEETLSHLSRKAGLGWDGWREGAGYQVFEAIVFHERE